MVWVSSIVITLCLLGASDYSAGPFNTIMQQTKNYLNYFLKHANLLNRNSENLVYFFTAIFRAESLRFYDMNVEHYTVK